MEDVPGTQGGQESEYYTLLYRGYDGYPRRSGNYKLPYRGYKWNPGRSELDVTVNITTVHILKIPTVLREVKNLFI
jgi:hypothetical protein